MDHQTIVDQSDLRKWRIELPNLYDDADLDPYEFRLLAHYKRVGTCTEGLTTTAKKCHMSVGQASEKRRSLEAKGWIVTKPISTPRGKGVQVEIVDKWEENFEHYSSRRAMRSGSAGRGTANSSLSHSEIGYSPGEEPPSPGETKNQPVKNKPDKNLGAGAPSEDMSSSAVPTLIEPLKPIEPGSYRDRLAQAMTRNEAGRIAGAADLSWLGETYRPLAEAFITATNIRPIRSDQSYWRKSLSDQAEIGLTPDHITAAVARMRADGLTIKDPGSITAVARDMLANSMAPTLSPRVLAGQARTKGYRNITNERLGR